MLRLEFKEEFDCVSRAVTPSIKTLWLSGVLTLKKVKSINTNLFRLQHIASHCYQDQDHGQGGPLHPPILHYHPRRQHCPDRRSWVTLFRGSKLGEQHPGHDCDTGQSPGLRPFVDKPHSLDIANWSSVSIGSELESGSPQIQSCRTLCPLGRHGSNIAR